MIYIVLAVLFLHIVTLPIIFGTEIAVDSDIGIVTAKCRVFGICIFFKKLGFEDLKQRLPSSVETSEEVSEKVKRSGLRPFLTAFALNALKRLRIRYAEVEATVGTGDAAATAAVIGVARIAAASACAARGYRGNIGDISPDFDNECVKIDFIGIFSLCIADIIYAVCAAVRSIAARRARRGRIYANNVAE